MKMNRKPLIFAILLGMMCFMAQAQNNSLGKNDPDAKKVLDGLSAKLKSYKAVKSNFTLKVEDSKGKLQGSKNGVIYIKGSKYHIALAGGTDIYSDGKDIWTYDKSSNEVTITKSDPSTQTINPETIFTDFYDKDFLYKLNGESALGTRTVEEVELTPVDKTKPFFKALLYIDKSGNRFTLNTNNLNGNAPLTDADLAYNKAKYPGAEEVDLRN